ncbi:MAG: YidC/Oxa1 family membrane protein insertase [Coriobacteriia bacterium]|nr:YidC/Oxa1 family membrane protein insertase [Coriobacteriia bacterium]
MGIWTSFVNLLFEALLQVYYVVGDWGLAIILLTVVFRLLMTPLMIKQVRSTYELQKVQPLMKEIQNKYRDNPEEQRKKMAELYSEHKINPFASCLPMLLQMPLFFALFQMLAAPMGDRAGGPLWQYFEAQGGGTGSFFGIIPDIMLSSSRVFAEQGWAAAVPYVVLLVLFASSMLVPTLMMPGDKNQRWLMGGMSLFMLYIGWGMPAGVLLYWDTSSFIGIGQQWFVQRAMKKATGDDEIVVDKPKKKSQKQLKHEAAREEATGFAGGADLTKKKSAFENVFGGKKKD